MTRKIRIRTLALPPILAGSSTPQIRKQAERFFYSIAEIFEAWVTRRKSKHTQRAYREDIMSFVRFLEITWPDECIRLLSVSIKDVLAFRDEMLARDLAPKTLNRRISSLSSFYKYLAAAAAELRLPITVPNPAHAQFIARECTDPRYETKALSAARARQLIGLPTGETVLDYRDRAILKLICIPESGWLRVAALMFLTFTKVERRRPSGSTRRAINAGLLVCILWRPARSPST